VYVGLEDNKVLEMCFSDLVDGSVFKWNWSSGVTGLSALVKVPTEGSTG